ncbi:MAG TPA: helix-turn-helix transcriptional regulator, partial [Rubrobacter sp.]|nr:helix-turn-helix transcriptional regulator [Rubrobacter sp.]
MHQEGRPLCPEGVDAVVGMPPAMLERAEEGADGELSARQLEIILLLAARGLSNGRIASSLHISQATKRHLANVNMKMGV